jgi:hypothetical protein
MSSNGASGKPKTSAPPPSSALERKWLMPVILGLFIMSTIYFLEGKSAEIVPQDVTYKNVTTNNLVPSPPTPTNLPSPASSSNKPGHKQDPTSKISGNSPRGKVRSDARPVTFEKMLEAFEAKRQELYKKLEQDYGLEYFEKLKVLARKVFKTNGNEAGFKRKLMLKIVQAQAAAKSQTSRNLQSGDWSNITSHERRKMQEADLDGFPTYVWATGGHRYVVSS